MKPHWQRLGLMSTSQPWRLFYKPPQDIQALLDVHSRHTDPDYMNADDELTTFMVQKTLRAARWNYRLRTGKWLWKALQRATASFYKKNVHSRYLLAVKKIRGIAEREEALQTPSESSGTEE